MYFIVTIGQSSRAQRTTTCHFFCLIFSSNVCEAVFHTGVACYVYACVISYYLLWQASTALQLSTYSETIQLRLNVFGLLLVQCDFKGSLPIALQCTITCLTRDRVIFVESTFPLLWRLLNFPCWFCCLSLSDWLVKANVLSVFSLKYFIYTSY